MEVTYVIVWDREHPFQDFANSAKAPHKAACLSLFNSKPPPLNLDMRFHKLQTSVYHAPN